MRTTPPSKIKDFAHLPLHRGGFRADDIRPYEGIVGVVGGRFVNRPYEVLSKTRVILSERSESKNLRTEGQRCRNDNAKILRLRTSCFAQDDRDFR